MAVPAALTKAQAAEGDIDVNELVFGHIGDAYQWHIAKFGDTEVSIPLPVIVKSSTGWHVFSSARLEEGPYEGLYVAEGGAYDGKIVERNAAGEEVRPLDISITKNVLGLFINSAVLLVIMMSCVRWYKKHPLEDGAPKGGVGMIEATVLSIYNDVIKGCIGENYRRYAPYLLTAFFFILVNNLMGLIPIFPGGANVTGNIAITLVLVVVGRTVLEFAGRIITVSEAFITAWSYLRFVALALVMTVLLVLLYMLSQGRRRPLREVLPGVGSSLAAWLVLSMAFSYYVEHVGQYSVLYGSIATVIVVLLWLYMSGQILVLGAEFSAALIDRETTAAPLGEEEDK